MNPHRVVSINCSSFSSVGPWGIAVRPSFGGQFQQLLAPIFENKFYAEVFAAWLPLGYTTIETPEAELQAALELTLFINAWDEKHGDDGCYPTPDGEYPKPDLMARWFAESRQPRGIVGKVKEALRGSRP